MRASGADGEVVGQVDAFVTDLDALVDALRQDPVNVQQVLGNGHTVEVDAELTEIAASSEVPIYVALLGDLPDLAVDDPTSDLAVRLQSELDPQAVYVLAAGDTGPSFFYAGDDPDLESAIYDGLSPTYPDWDDEDALHPSAAGEAAIIASVVAADDHTVPAALVETYTETPTWTAGQRFGDDEPYLLADVSAAAAFTGLLVALVCWRLTRTWALRALGPAPAPPSKRQEPARPRPAVREAGPSLDDVRRDAASTLDKLAAELADRPHGPGVEDALGCRVAAESVIDSDDLLDVVGALVLARSGRRLLDDPEHPYRPCFVNPLHGGARYESDLAVGGGGTVTLPVCRRCEQAAASGKPLDPLLERRFAWLPLPERPYFEGSSIWARTGYGGIDPEPWRRVGEPSR